MADLLFVNIRRRPRQFRELIDIQNFTDEELRARYRFGRQAVGYITNLIADDLRRSTRRNHALPPLQQVLIALRFFASGSFLQVIGDTAGVNKSTVSRVVTSVSPQAAQAHASRKWGIYKLLMVLESGRDLRERPVLGYKRPLTV